MLTRNAVLHALAALFVFGLHLDAAPRILLGYLDNWTPGYSVADVERSEAAKHLTHLAYAFANVRSGVCALSDPARDSTNIAALRELHRRYPELKILISIGGANAANTAGFAAAAKSSGGRAKLAASCIRLFLSGDSPFDGVDLDWEFPTAADRSNFTALLTEFRVQMNASGRHFLLTIAAPAGKQNYSQLDLGRVAAQVSFINLMTYDYTGSWSKQTGHAAPLASVEATVKDYLHAGVPPAKIVLGLPFFGQGWTGVAPANHGLFQPAIGPSPGHAAFRDLQKLAGFTGHDDRANKAHWVYNPRTRAFWSFDDQRVILEKVRYLKLEKLAGAMVWSLKDDTPKAWLVKAIANELR